MSDAAPKANIVETRAPIGPPLVSVVIINFNYGDFVEQAIRSIDAQDYDNIECLVVDCASTDNSLAAIEGVLGRTRRSVFRLLRRDANHGQVVNALSTLNEVKGVFVTYLDSDDVLFPDFVSTHVAAHLNDVNSASLTVSDQVQMDATCQMLAASCHWHQKWRASEPGSPWSDLSQARHWSAHSPYRLQPFTGHLHYVPAWWSSWLPERWIWSTTSGLMFRTSVIDILAPAVASHNDLRAVSLDGYFGRFAHSVGGTLVIDNTLGAYRRHGKNIWSDNTLLGGQTPNGTRDLSRRFIDSRQIARTVLTTKYAQLVRRLGADLYYSIAWQLMSNKDFKYFIREHPEDRPAWERTIQAATGSPS
jgi:glycosyltransferase involved in cell wall biosynthesis